MVTLNLALLSLLGNAKLKHNIPLIEVFILA